MSQDDFSETVVENLELFKEAIKKAYFIVKTLLDIPIIYTVRSIPQNGLLEPNVCQMLMKVVDPDILDFEFTPQNLKILGEF